MARTAGDVLDATRGVLALHSSDPCTPHLAMWARVEGFETGDLDRALIETRSLWRLHAMRRTLFVVARDEAPMFLAAAAVDIASKERRRLEGWIAAGMAASKVGPWLKRVEREVSRALAESELEDMLTQELSAAIPELARQIELGSGKWTRPSPVSSRLLYLMAMDGKLVRTRPAGSWRSSQYRWASVERWFDDEAPAEALTRAEAEASLVGRYLETHGPATFMDIKWWTGWTVKKVRAALAGLGAVPVTLDECDDEGWVLADDLPASKAKPKASVALLPGLDSAPMSRKRRAWFLGPHGPALFDRNGNIGPTIWFRGRIVGGWAVRPEGVVATRLLEDIGTRATNKVKAEARALGAWLDGEVVTPRFRTPLERELVDGAA